MTSLAFHAISPNLSTGELKAVLRGVGDIAEARTSTIYLPDWEDIWRPYRSTEPGYVGARRVENLLLDSGQFALAGANWTGTNIAVTDNSVASSDGTIDGASLVDTGGGGTGFVILQQANADVFPINSTMTIAFEVKPGSITWCAIDVSALGSQTILAYFDLGSGVVGSGPGADGVSHLIEPLNNGWFRVSVAFTTDTVDTTARARLFMSSGEGGFGTVPLNETSTMFAAHAQLELVSGQADPSPSEYQATTTAAVAKVFATQKDGTLLTDLPWLYGGPAATNEQIRSDNLANAEWTATTMTVVKDAIGLRGEANGASTLTATAGNATVIANAITAGSANQTTRWFIKRKTGTGVIEITVDGGSTWEDVTTEVDSTAGFNEAIESLAALTNPQIGIRIVTNTDAVIVGNAEAHTAKTQNEIRGSTPIFTAASTVTVNATDLSFDDGNHVDLEGAYFLEFKNVGLSAASLGGLVGLGANARLFYTPSAVDFRSFDGTTVNAGPSTPLVADDTEYKLGLAYGSSLQRINADDSWGVATAYDGVYNNSESKLNVLHSNTTAGSPVTVMLMRNLRRYDMTYAEAIIAIPEMMNGIFPGGLPQKRLTVIEALRHTQR